MSQRRWLFTLCLFWLTGWSPLLLAGETAEEPTLTIEADGGKTVYKRSELLQRPDLVTIDVATDPSYPGRKMSYKAVPAAKLFSAQTVPAAAVIQFQCLDGFSAPINREQLLNEDPKGSIAYIAIEPADAPWPAVKTGGPSAGPFYLVWPQPKLSQIGPEQWPFQLSGFVIKENMRQLYPKIFPAADASAAVQQGFAVFTKNCFPCHTVNRQGAAEVGPDLNVPYSPTEYLNRKALRRLIRNPQDLRYFPKSRMSPFPASALPDAQLTQLLAYLTHMAKHKVAAPDAKHH